MPEMVKARLLSFGYTWAAGDEALLDFSIQKAENTIKNTCNVLAVPEGLVCVAVDMAAGEFLSAKRAFASKDLAALDIEDAVKQVQAGDTSVVFREDSTPAERVDAFLNYLLTYGAAEMACYRKLRW